MSGWLRYVAAARSKEVKRNRVGEDGRVGRGSVRRLLGRLLDDRELPACLGRVVDGICHEGRAGDVARMRADPLLKEPPRLELIDIPTALLVPKITVAPGARLSEVAAASLNGASPGGPNSSTPTCIVAVSVDVQEKRVPRYPEAMTPGTE